jgi:hypothetical protein
MSCCARICTDESSSDSSSEEIPEHLEEELRKALESPSRRLEAFSAASALVTYFSLSQQRTYLASSTDLTVHNVENAFAISWTQGSTWVVACRGTELDDWKDLLDDVDIRLKPVYWAEPSCAHEGFLRHFQKLQLSVIKALLSAVTEGQVDTVLFSGHSLGSATAYLLAMFCAEVLEGVGYQGEIYVRGFGGPRVGDASFYTWCAQKRGLVGIVAYQNSCDLVTKVPIRLSDNWAQKTVVFQRSELPLRAHSMQGYFEEILCMGEA